MDAKKIFILFGINILLLAVLLFVFQKSYTNDALLMLGFFTNVLVLPVALLLINFKYTNNVLINLFLTLLFLIFLHFLNVCLIWEDYDQKSADIIRGVLLISLITSFIGSNLVFWYNSKSQNDLILKSKLLTSFYLIVIFSIFFYLVNFYGNYEYEIREYLISYFNLERH